ncbi:Uncharacterised protein [Streptococcus dysgalactiae subsp. dysgalactiae]|uniref:Uncharacterized protein n=1 Tax=Streptococcus dysgalactiae subsp. dysgalactiae TaxID=99822 RepID=A0A380JR12_STRDY|nr:Uncharacterised protein [Streptococcus dysgalactiae subsp. dysgalactiae]
MGIRKLLPLIKKETKPAKAIVSIAFVNEV